MNEINEALIIKNNLGVAKNVILFIGDGMGAQTVTAARIHKGGEGHRLIYETFPHMGLLKVIQELLILTSKKCIVKNTTSQIYHNTKHTKDNVVDGSVLV